METYTFSVNYIQGPDQTKQLADVQVKGLIGKPFTIKSAQSGLQSSIRSLVAFCGTLPMLPGKLPSSHWYTDRHGALIVARTIRKASLGHGSLLHEKFRPGLRTSGI